MENKKTPEGAVLKTVSERELIEAIVWEYMVAFVAVATRDTSLKKYTESR